MLAQDRNIDYAPWFLPSVLTVAVLLFPLPSASATLPTEVESEVGYSEPQGKITKAQVEVRSEWTDSLSNRSQITVIPRLRLDLADSLNSDTRRPDNYHQGDIRLNGPLMEAPNARFDLAEAYLDFYPGTSAIRLGKQQVVWGQADGLRVLDVVNPQDLREFNLPEFEDSRIPTWMLNADVPVSQGSSVQWLLIPDLTFNEQADAGTDFQITSPELVPQPSGDVPVQMKTTSRPDTGEIETGLRWKAFLSGWDLTANYFWFFRDNPAIYRRLDTSSGSLEVQVTPSYERSHLFGVSASNAFSDWVLRLEAGYFSDSYFVRNDLKESGIRNSPELASVTGIDYYGISDLMISYQLFYSRVLDYDEAVVRRKDSVRHSFLITKSAWNNTLEMRLFGLLNTDYNDGQTRASVTYQLNDTWSLWTGVDHFYGDRAGPFGQFSEASRLIAGWQASF